MSRIFRPVGLLLAAATLSGTFSCGSSGDCTVVDNQNGTQTMTCPDGRSVTLPRLDETQPPGGIAGRAFLFGREDHGGITVQPSGSEEFVTTDASGAFLVERLPAGFHVLNFDAPGYAPRSKARIMVLPGENQPTEVTLKVGTRIAGGDALILETAPDEKSFLVKSSTFAQGAVSLVLPRPLVKRSLGDKIAKPTYEAGGELLYYLAKAESWDGPGELYRMEVRSGKKKLLAKQVRSWKVASNGSVVIERYIDENTRRELAVWDARTSKLTTVATDLVSDAWRTDGRTVVALAGRSPPTLIAWDLVAAGGNSLGAATELPQLVAEESGCFVYLSGDQYLLWDAFRRAPLPVGPNVNRSQSKFNEAGDRVILKQGATISVWDLATLTEVQLTASGQDAVFAPDGRSVLFTEDEVGSTLEELQRWNAETGTVQSLSRHESIRFDLQPSPDGARVFYVVDDGASFPVTGTLWVTDSSGARALGPTHSHAGSSVSFSPDGAIAAFTNDRSLSLWEMDQGEPWIVREHSDGSMGDVMLSLRWSAEGRRLAFVSDPERTVVNSSSLGALHLVDTETREVTRLGELVPVGLAQGAIDHYAFGEDGSLTFLQRARHEAGANGSEIFRGALSRWDPADGEVEIFSEGVGTGYRVLRAGNRALFPSRPLTGTGIAVASLYDRALGPALPVDDDITFGGAAAGGSNGTLAVGANWQAWTVTAGNGKDRNGVHLSYYPDEPPDLSDEEDAEGVPQAPGEPLPEQDTP